MNVETRLGPEMISGRLNRIPAMTRTHRRWLAVLAALLVVDMADLNTFAYAAPGIRKDWGLSVGNIGTITAASFLGMFVGSVIGGRVADRIGRKWAIIGSTMIFSIFSLLSAFSFGPTDLAIYRVLTGVGLAALTVIVLTYVSEMFPQTYRGRAQTWIVVISLIGIPIMAWAARSIVPLGPGMWRWIFVLGSAGIPLILVVARYLPESARWLAENGDITTADAIVTGLEREAKEKLGGELPAPEALPIVVTGHVRDLFRGAYRRRTLVLAAAMALALSGFYGYNSWVPTLLTEHGFTTKESLTYTSVMSLATVPGAMLTVLFIDRIERRTAVFLVYSAVATLMLVFGFTGSNLILVASGTLVTMLLQSATPMMYTYLPEIFPTGLRGLGAGLCNGIGRLAVVGTSFLIAAILSIFGFTAVFLYLAGAVFCAGLVMQLFGERTLGRTLSDINSTARTSGRQ